METPEKSSNARVAAILALVAVFVVVLIVIASVGGGGGGDSGSSQANGSGGTAKSHKDSHRKVYVVKPGDTFSEIAQKVGISVNKLQSLNPHIDQFTLQSGDRVKLR
jgi:LysM repeat protein